MQLLVDTNVLIWTVAKHRLLSPLVRERFESGECTIFVSVVSAWEYNQKRAHSPDDLPVPFDDLVAAIPYQRLDLVFDVARYAATLPRIHRDPFDRMLIAQALHHGLTLVASDANIRRYDVPVLW